MGSFKGESKNLKQLLADGRYVVPINQREYAWGNDQTRQFLDDLLHAHDNKLKDYFFGPLVFIPTGDDKHEFFIVDGQQRMATTMILFSVIRDYLYKLRDDKTAGKVHSSIQEEERRRIINKITLGNRNKDFFEKLTTDTNEAPDIRIAKIKKDSPLGTMSRSNRLLFNTYELFFKEIGSKLPSTKGKPISDDVEFLYDLYDTMLLSFEMMAIKADSDEDAYKIFESLNAKGLELAIADLVKNYVLSKAVSDKKKLYDKWEKMINTLDKADLDDFLRHHWLAHEGAVHQQQLYKEIKTQKNTERKILDYVDSVVEDAELYHALNSPESGSSTAHWHGDKKTTEHLRYLRSLKSEVFLPLLLMAKRKFDTTDFRELVEMCVILFVRYKTIGNGSAGTLEQMSTRLATKLRTGGSPSLSDVRTEFMKINPSDTKFEEDFKNAEISYAPTAVYILSKLEDHIAGGNLLEKTPRQDITLEHILPRSRDKYWSHIPEEVHAKFVNRIGNLTLLVEFTNKEVLNKTFAEKRAKAFSGSKLEMNKMLLTYVDWNENSINDRQKKLASTAKQVWKL